MEFITSDQRIAVENFYIGKIYTITFKNGSYITRACIGKGADYVMFQEESPKMLFTLNMQTAPNIDSIELGGGGSGTTNYNELDNKPQINSVTLSGNKSSSDLGLQDAISEEAPISASYVSGLATVATTGAYSDLSGLPTLGTAAAAAATDFATAAQGSKADEADTAISTAATGFASLDARLDSMDTTISGKQGALSSTQLDAVNSGIDSTKVAQIESNKTNILLSEQMNGKKNYFNNSLSSGSSGNITYTVNPDKSITFTTSGAVTTESYIDLEASIGNKYVGKWLCGATPKVKLAISRPNYSVACICTGSPVQIPNDGTYKLFIVIPPQEAFSNETIYPMVIDDSAYTAGFTDYQPYAMSNVELTAAIQAIQAQLANT